MTKKALLVGLNAYQPPISPLRGCVNDVLQIQEVLQRYYAFAEEDIKVLLDRDATRERILDELDWLVEGAQPGHVLIFHYSGHGSQVDDDSGDEWECRDEILVPYDHTWDHPLRDDHLKEKFDKVPPGANLTIISDSCHSGTVNKFPTDTEVPRAILVPPEIQERIAAKVARRNAEYKAYVAEEYRRLARELSAEELNDRIDEFLAQALDRFRENRFQFVETGENNILLAGCQDVQTSADAYIAGDWHGAFTYNLVRAILEAEGALTYEELVTEAGNGMMQYQQTPQLECPDTLKHLLVFRPLPDLV
jgi:hypothetical protein